MRNGHLHVKAMKICLCPGNMSDRALLKDPVWGLPRRQDAKTPRFYRFSHSVALLSFLVSWRPPYRMELQHSPNQNINFHGTQRGAESGILSLEVLYNAIFKRRQRSLRSSAFSAAF